MKVASFVREGLVVAFSIADGDSTSYHLLLSPKASTSADAIRIADLSRKEFAWTLTRAAFVSSGEPYRIVEANDPGGDGLEITFRRGWPKLLTSEPRVDEKILYSDCGLAYLGPLPTNWRETGESPWTTLLEVEGVRRIGHGR